MGDRTEIRVAPVLIHGNNYPLRKPIYDFVGAGGLDSREMIDTCENIINIIWDEVGMPRQYS